MSIRRSLTAALLILLSACAKPGEAPIGENFVSNTDATVERTVATGTHKFLVLGKDRLDAGLAAKRFLTTASSEARVWLGSHAGEGGAVLSDTVTAATPDTESLLVGYPVGLLGERQLFGGVITKVSDGTKELLGDLKLSDLTPVHVRTVLARNAVGDYGLTLVGCVRGCGEGAAEESLVTIPIVAIDEVNALLVLDLASLGEELNLMDILDPGGEYTKMNTVSAKTVAFDYSLSTLVFDVESRMVPKEPATSVVPETVFTARWYLRLASFFDPAFEARGAAEGVGFFMTERGRSPKIHRFARPSSINGTPGTVKYYVKNVPIEYQAAFQAAFDGWNAAFRAISGAPLLSYEFIAATDPRAKVLVAGDIRYRIIEWDIDNNASYGGLGPSIANQHTGQILSSNVLVQGPGIVTKYTAWFQGSAQIRALLAAGRSLEAEQRHREMTAALKTAERVPASLKLRLGSRLEFRTPAHEESLEDPAAQRDDFDLVPPTLTYLEYMRGYFTDLVGHELGHNLGLRHNFRGNLGAATALGQGGVSASIMEYLGRSFRYLDEIGIYDIMALKYGYLGVAPEKLGTFCTDEDVATVAKAMNSAECSRDDATDDPFGYFETRLARAYDLLVTPSSAEAPVWTVPDMEKELAAAVGGVGLYAASAPLTAARWTNFFGKPGRPSVPADVKPFVLERLKARLCDPTLATVLAAKATPEARRKVEKNIADLRVRVAKILEPMNLYSPADLTCTL